MALATKDIEVRKINLSTQRPESLILYLKDSHPKTKTLKYLLFPAQFCTAAYVCVNLPRFFIFSTQYCPLYTTESAIEREGRSLFPSKLRLTQSTANITAAMMIYKASTFRLRPYKAYMRMITIPISGEKKI
jgi:hypothetical protein